MDIQMELDLNRVEDGKIKYNLRDYYGDLLDAVHNNSGQSFSLFCKHMKGYYKYNVKNSKNKGILNYDVNFNKHLKPTEYYYEEILNMDKREVIILSPSIKQLNDLKFKKKKYIFPFDKIFIESPMVSQPDEDGVIAISFGFFLQAMKNEENKIENILATCIWLSENKKESELEGTSDINYGELPQYAFPESVIIPFDSLTNPQTDEGIIVMKNEDNVDENTQGLRQGLASMMTDIIRKTMKLIESKEYREYYKWTPTGISKNEITYCQDVKSHRRHFWKDSGRFKIAFLTKEEVTEKGYEIDGVVFKKAGGVCEVRRDVPYKIIDAFTRGKEKERKETNRIIELFQKKIYRSEQQLGKILWEIFPDELIRHNKGISKNCALRLDWNIVTKNIAFEYDGAQHFDKDLYEKLYGEGFEEQIKRDKDKNKICEKRGITLIRIKYDEPLTKTYIIKRLKEKGLW